MMNINPKLKVINNHAYANSLDLAKHFQKSHDRVLKDIRYTISSLNSEQSSEFSLVNFDEREYKNSRGQIFPMFNLSRDGFALVAMGFTGREALKWKIKYIQAFNELETTLNARIIKDKHFGQLKFHFPDAAETIEESLPFMTVSYAIARLTEIGLMIPPVSRRQLIGLIQRGTLGGFKNDLGWCIYAESFNRFIKMRRGQFQSAFSA